jgi:signal transduction histidine kinase
LKAIVRRSGSMRKSAMLVIAFAALFAVIAASAFAVWWNARTDQVNVAALHSAHLERNAALASIRESIYLTGMLTRDYLLEPDASRAQQYIAQFSEIRAKTEQSFQILDSPDLDAVQRAALQKLRQEFEVYRDPTEVVLDWTPEERRAQRMQMLTERGRRRDEVFALAQQVENLMTENFTREREHITSAEQAFRFSLSWTAAIALVLALGITFITLSRMMALERQSLAAESELRLLSGQIRTTQEQERKYLSRELHDQVGQMLTGLRMELAALARMQSGDSGEASLRITRAKDIVEQTLGVVRNIAMLLRPSMLDDIGLAPALTWLVKEVSRSSGIEISPEIDPLVDSLPDAHRTCIYRVVQEALTNASRHSGARSIQLILRSDGPWVHVSISDDGRGFDAGAPKRRGLGLLGMEERVREFGGSTRISSSPGRGTHIQIQLPQPLRREEGIVEGSDSGRSRDRADRLKASP